MSSPNIFSERLVTRRNRLNLSQEDLAEKADVSPNSVSAWERGVNPPKLAMLQKLSSVLGVSVAWLMGQDEQLVSEATAPFSPSEAACRRHFEDYLKTCEGDAARLGWTQVVLQEQFPLDRWAARSGRPSSAPPRPKTEAEVVAALEELDAKLDQSPAAPVPIVRSGGTSRRKRPPGAT